MTPAWEEGWDAAMHAAEKESARLAAALKAEQHANTDALVRVQELEAALWALHEATDPWMENAPPGEQMTQEWLAMFQRLGAARSAAVELLAQKGKQA